MSLPTRRTLFSLLPAMAITTGLMLGIPAAHAQPPGGGGMTPEMQKQIQAWRTFQDNHKNVSALQQTLRAMAEMDKTPTTKITGAQAKKILPILSAWRSKPVMTDAQARDVNKKITAAMTIPQIKAIASSRGGGGRRVGRPGISGHGVSWWVVKRGWVSSARRRRVASSRAGSGRTWATAASPSR